MSQPAQPKIVQKLLLRTAILLLAVAGGFLGIRALLNVGTVDKGSANTEGKILALMDKGDGNQVVLINPDGSIQESPGYEAGKDDREAVWRPDGTRVIFSSDREENNYHLYRWNLDANRIERRTIGSRALANPRFLPTDTEPTATALVTAGGRVLNFDPNKDGYIRQVLPPPLKDAQAAVKDNEQEAASGGGEFDLFYRDLGNSFREAKWSHDRTYIAAVMRRETGEVLVVQNVVATDPQERQPIPVMYGSRIDFDVNPVGPGIVFTVQNFEFASPNDVPAEYRKDGKVVLPFRHFVGIFDPTKDAQSRLAPILQPSKTNATAFGTPVFSADGSKIAFIQGKYVDGSGFEPERLMVAIPERGIAPLTNGAIYDPAWHPNGQSLLFIRRGEDGQRSIWSVNNDGSNERNLTQGKGNFAKPQYSPQSK